MQVRSAKQPVPAFPEALTKQCLDRAMSGKGYPGAGRAALQPLLSLQHFQNAEFQVTALRA